MSRGILGSARLVAACTAASRVLGMARDVLCAHYFGASLVWDAFVIAFVVPNLFRRLFGEGALTGAFVPVFVERLEKEGKPSAERLLRSLVGVLSLVLIALVLAGIALTFLLPALSDSPKLRAICEMLRIMLPYVLLICTAAILGAALNSLGHFFAPAFAPVVLNVVWIGAMLWFGPDISVVVWAVVAAGVLQLAIQAPPLLRRGINPLPRFRREPGLGQIAALFFPIVLGLALVQINELVDQIIAELCVEGDGAVSTLYYGNRLMQLPLALVGISLATVIFPLLSAHSATADAGGFADSLGKALRACLFVSIPAAVGLAALARPTIRVLYEHGRFGEAETTRTTLVLILYALGIVGASANAILVRAFYARRETRVAVRVSASLVFANVALNLTLVWPMAEAGLALASAVTQTASPVILYVLLRRRIPGLRCGALPVLLRSGLLAAAMGAAVWGFHAWLIALLPDDTIARAACLAASVALGIALYFGAARLLGITWRSGTSRG